jgi:hypothetical protein
MMVSVYADIQVFNFLSTLYGRDFGEKEAIEEAWIAELR